MNIQEALQKAREAYARVIYASLMFRLKMRAIREKQGK